MKKFLILLLTLSMLISCYACGAADNGNDNGGDSQPPQGSVNDDDLTTGYKTDTYRELFANPSNEYRINDINHEMSATYKNSPTNFRTSINTKAAEGVGGFVTNIYFKNGYLRDPDAFTDLNKAVKLLKNKGFNFWLYDELGYPSGGAGGITVDENPEYVASGLVCITKTGNGKNAVTVNKDNDLMKLRFAYAVDANGNVHSATVTDNKVSFGGVSGSWTLYVFAVKKFYEGTHAQNNAYAQSDDPLWVQPDYINIMDKNAVAAFINNTYKRYAEEFDYFSEVVGIFTDEPSLMEPYQNTSAKFKYAQLAWVEGFNEKFEEMHGYDIETKLHEVFFGTSDEAKIIRTNYRQTVAELVAKNYFGQIAEFCEENGTKSSGHALLEESVSNHAYYYGDLMKCLREMGIAGADSLRGMYDGYTADNFPVFMAIKYASSATTLEGKDRMTMVELCAPDFTAFPFPEDERDNLWRVANLMAFEGITSFNSYVDVKELGTRTKEFTNYIARLSYISRHARWEGEVGLYYPINSFQATATPVNSQNRYGTTFSGSINETAMKIWQNNLDFTVVDNEFILEATVENGKIFTDAVSFSAICMSGTEVVPLNVLKKLLEFEQSGGKVVWIDCIPSLPDKLSDVEEFNTLVSSLKVTKRDDAIEQVKEHCDRKLKIERETPSLFVGTYTLDGAPMYWLFNNHDLEKNLTLSYEGALGFDVYDPMTGEIESIAGDSFKINIGVSNAKIVVVKY